MVLKYIIIIQIILFLFVKTDISAQSTYDQTLEECFGTYDFALYSNKDELHIDTDYLDGWLSTLWPTYSPFAIVFMAMSLGTYNASSYTCMTTFYPVNLVAALYIESNYENLALDSARGDGEHLYSLAKIFGCDEKNIHQFNFEIKNHYSFIFGDTKNSTPTILNNTIEIINKNEILSASCINV